METISGTVDVRRMNVGSRSEGDYVWIAADDARELMLYRADVYPAGDSFLRSLVGMRIFADGEEDANGYFRVEAVRLADGSPCPFPQKAPPPLPSNFDFGVLSATSAERKSARPLFPKKSKKRCGRH